MTSNDIQGIYGSAGLPWHLETDVSECLPEVITQEDAVAAAIAEITRRQFPVSDLVSELNDLIAH